MQETNITEDGTALIANDMRFFNGAGDRLRYSVYPSIAFPRFIIPEEDVAARRFIASIIAADWRTHGFFSRLGSFLAPLVLTFFGNYIVLAQGNEELTALIRTRWSVLPRSEESFDSSALRVTKFCQHIAGQDTKILFLATYKGAPLCVLKTIRNALHDTKLHFEKEAQERAGAFAPKVYFDGTFNKAYIYAEEVFQGAPISRTEALKREEEIVRAVTAFPVDGAVSSRAVADALALHIPSEDPHFPRLIGTLRATEVMFQTGLAHGDFGRPNILFDGRSLRIIDWERTRERPFHLLDAVYFMARLHRISTQEGWKEHALPLFIRTTEATAEEGTALFSLLMCYQRLKHKYPDHYQKAVDAVRAII